MLKENVWPFVSSISTWLCGHASAIPPCCCGNLITLTILKFLSYHLTCIQIFLALFNSFFFLPRIAIGSTIHVFSIDGSCDLLLFMKVLLSLHWWLIGVLFNHWLICNHFIYKGCPNIHCFGIKDKSWNQSRHKTKYSNTHNAYLSGFKHFSLFNKHKLFQFLISSSIHV